MPEPIAAVETKSDLAYGQVRDRILSGELEPGSVIQQRELARSIGISTTPLREALRRLKSEGLVDLDAHRDARVAPLRAEEARDLLELRRSLDPLAASLAAERRTKADIRAIRAAADGLAPLPPHPSVGQLVAHRRFHAAIYTASHNDLLIGTLESLWDKADRYRRLALRTDRGQEARDQKAREHDLLVECVALGDSAGAEEIMRGHIDTSLGATAVRRLGHAGSAASAREG
ncbi:GntR family transcriptional regulator [Streptomyces scabiei]|uniref:GntR family transcriptional regulator n=1 Tax=Streptomyces scabiei TaxID=1930 RepID=UPI0029BDD4FB|nr:GntR family transcriptional regulator [Streptomyces scabiei]MDX2536337.1 GntR family transcriptional regulator [Streptomyces scabiei]MDX2799543.1 GntR family transcriptional regulator [Streptomyces scabiei]MDX2855357.1 GntR family transcriptional regulator [Streptomyces scabiei]MDX3828200.1 GntR family transcriptional regulator [Streptomyces scabiei]